MITVTENNINITDSYTYSKKSFKQILNEIKKYSTNCKVTINRSINNLCREWATHNLLYNLHLFRSHTKDVDLNYPQKWYINLIYFIFGNISLIFIK